MLIVVATSAALSSVFMINLSFGIGHMVGEWPTAGRGLQHLRVSLCPERHWTSRVIYITVSVCF